MGRINSSSVLAHRRYRPIFVLFLICGPYVLVPFLLLLPAMTSLRAIWHKSPTWRFAVIAFMLFAVAVTGPLSPTYLNAEFFPFRVPATRRDGWNSLLAWQIPGVNRALIANCVFLPLTTISACETLLRRRKQSSINAHN